MLTRRTAIPLKAYRSVLRSRDVVVWTLVFWPAVALAAWLLGDPIGGETVSFEAVLFVLPLLWFLGRPATLVLPDGIRVVPYFGRARTYLWLEIEDIRDEVRGHARGGSPIYGVRMYVAGGRRRWLPSLGNHTRAISELHAYVEEHRSPTADTVPDAAVTGGLVSGRPGHTRLRVLAGAALVVFGLLLGLAGIGAGVAQTRLASTGVVTEATVTDVQPKSCYKYSCDCPLTWTFTDRSGTTYAGTSDDCSSLYDEAEVGATIPVVYDPTVPTVNQVNDRPPDPAGPAAAGALFAYFALGAGVGLVLAPVRMGMKRPSGSEPHM